MATNISSGFTGSVTASGKMMRDMQANAQAYAQSIATINRVSAQTGTDATLMKTMAWIESRFNSTASRGAAGAKGLYQFIPSTAAQYGINGQELNVEASTQAYVKLLQNNIKSLQKYGVEINGANLYLAHQQGAGGLKQIMDAAAGRGEMSSKVAANMRNNLLPGVDNSPVAFLDSWRKKYAEIESGVKQVFGATQKTTEATKQAANATGTLSDHAKQQASTTAKIIPFWETVNAKTKTSKEHVIEYGRAIEGAGVDAKKLADALVDKRMDNEMQTLIVNATKQASLLQDTGYEIRKNELLQLEFNKAQAQAVLGAESNLIYLQEERKLRLEMATIKAGGGMAATYRAGLNDKTLSDDQKVKLTSQYMGLQFAKQSEENKAQILQLKLTEEAYKRLTLVKDGYTQSQINGLMQQDAVIKKLTHEKQLISDMGAILQGETIGALQKLASTGNALLDKFINKMIESALTSEAMTRAFSSVFGSVGGRSVGSSIGNFLGGLLGGGRFASGGYFHNTVLQQTTPFMTSKGLAVAGEAGAEAVMPLINGSQVRAQMPDGSVQGLEITRINGILGVAIRETARTVGRYATGGTFNTSSSTHSTLNNSSISSDANVSLNFDVNINVSGGSESKETSVEVRKQLSDFEQRIYKNIPTIVRSAQVAARRSPNL
jgi:hypothetical protein